MQIVIILRKILDARSVSILQLQFSEHFQLIFDNSNVNKRQKKSGSGVSIEFVCLFKIFRIITFSALLF